MPARLRCTASLDFTAPLARFHAWGFKLGRWVDTVLMIRPLGTGAGSDSPGRDGPKGRMLISRRTVVCLGLAQLISWGTSYYLIGGFGEVMAADLGFSRGLIYGGFSVALLVMGLSSPLVGALIDRHGGRTVMIAGSLLNATGCVMLALCHTLLLYFAAWIVLGLAMRLDTLRGGVRRTGAA